MKRAISNAGWLLTGHVGRVGSQLLGVSIIARILTPADYGVVAIAMVVSSLAGLLRDLGTGPAAIRSSDSSLEFYGGIYTVQLLICAFLTSFIIVASPFLSEFYNNEKLTRILLIISLIFPITALGSVHLIVLEKSQRYRVISLIEVSSYIVGLGVAVVFARMGIGAESLAYQGVANAVVQTILLRKAADIHLVPMHPKYAKSAANGSAAVSSFYFFNYIIKNSDMVVAGRLATIDFLGGYSMATRIAQMPSQAIGALLSRISVPFLSHTEIDKPELSKNISGLIEFAIFSSVGVCLVLVSFRDTITGLLFGSQWLMSVPAQLNFLLPAAALTSVASVVVGIMTAMGATTALPKIGSFSAISHVCILAVLMWISPSLLPMAIFFSCAASFIIAIHSLMLMLIEKQIYIFRASTFFPLIFIFVYPFIELALGHSSQILHRSLTKEIIESTGVAFLCLGLVLFRKRRIYLGYYLNRYGANSADISGQ